MKCPGSGRKVRNSPETCRCTECGLVMRPTKDRRVPQHWASSSTAKDTPRD